MLAKPLVGPVSLPAVGAGAEFSALRVLAESPRVVPIAAAFACSTAARAAAILAWRARKAHWRVVDFRALRLCTERLAVVASCTPRMRRTEMGGAVMAGLAGSAVSGGSMLGIGVHSQG